MKTKEANKIEPFEPTDVIHLNLIYALQPKKIPYHPRVQIPSPAGTAARHGRGFRDFDQGNA